MINFSKCLLALKRAVFLPLADLARSDFLVCFLFLSCFWSVFICFLFFGQVSADFFTVNLSLRLVSCGLRIFCLIAGKRGCELRLFHSDFRLVSCGLRHFCLIVGKRGCGLSLFCRHFRLPAWSKEGGGGVPNEGFPHGTKKVMADFSTILSLFHRISAKWGCGLSLFWIESRPFRLVLCGLSFLQAF